MARRMMFAGLLVALSFATVLTAQTAPAPDTKDQPAPADKPKSEGDTAKEDYSHGAPGDWLESYEKAQELTAADGKLTMMDFWYKG